MSLVRVAGALISLASIFFTIFYILWFFGYLPINPELAVKLPVLAIVLALCFIAGWVGYVMLTAPRKPKQ
ncbi:MAG: hypothetical protein B6U65_00955 [Candidatus Wolframiiraptor sp. EX4484-121]|nr:MAG: hypothetical protein B6U65_00955 [Candidatus Wolframiiraptor sp. EX4484-121]